MVAAASRLQRRLRIINTPGSCNIGRMRESRFPCVERQRSFPAQNIFAPSTSRQVANDWTRIQTHTHTPTEQPRHTPNVAVAHTHTYTHTHTHTHTHPSHTHARHKADATKLSDPWPRTPTPPDASHDCATATVGAISEIWNRRKPLLRGGVKRNIVPRSVHINFPKLLRAFIAAPHRDFSCAFRVK